MTVLSFFRAAPEVLGPVLAAALPAGVCVGFDLTGEEPGKWTVENRGGAASVLDGLSDPLDCLLRGTSEDFLDVLKGGKVARKLFMSGAIQVEGDIGLVLLLQRAVAREGVLDRVVSPTR
jgi:putative sterol carrier protein